MRHDLGLTAPLKYVPCRRGSDVCNKHRRSLRRVREAARNESALSERPEIAGIANSPSVTSPYICLKNMLRVSRVLKTMIGISGRSFRKQYFHADGF